MDDQPDKTTKPTFDSIQAQIDAKMFAQSPIHILERYLESFAADGEMLVPVPKHILMALAERFRAFMARDSNLNSLDQAFGGKVARQRQARAAATREREVAWMVMDERRRLGAMEPDERGVVGTPHEIACEIVAEKLNLSVENVRRIYKDSKG